MTNQAALSLINSIKCKPYKINGYLEPYSNRLRIQVSIVLPDVLSGILGPLFNSTFIEGCTIECVPKEYLIRHVFDQIKDLAVHELQEWFEVNGEKVYYPHSRENAKKESL